MSQKITFILFILITSALTVVFTLHPEIDLYISDLFFKEVGRFYMRKQTFYLGMYRGVLLIDVLLGLWLIIGTLYSYAHDKPFMGLRRKHMLFLLFAMLIGPVAFVNAGLKEHWGRARPMDVTQFGGKKQFTPALQPADQCSRNCSFVSGHPATGYYVVSFALLSRGAPRIFLTFMAIFLGLLIGGGRVVQGAHFTSDVLFSGVVTMGSIWLLHYLMYTRRWYEKIATSKRLTQKQNLWWLGVSVISVLAAISYFFLDQHVAQDLYPIKLSHNPVVKAFSQFGLATGWLVGSGLAALIFWWRAKKLKTLSLKRLAQRCFYFFCTVAASGIFIDVIKIILGRPRPRQFIKHDFYGFDFFKLQAEWWSFPSGHAGTIFAVATALSILLPRYRVFYWIFALGVASTRILMYEHYISDVLVGGFTGIALTLFITQLFRRRGIQL